MGMNSITRGFGETEVDEEGKSNGGGCKSVLAIYQLKDVGGSKNNVSLPTPHAAALCTILFSSDF